MAEKKSTKRSTKKKAAPKTGSRSASGTARKKTPAKKTGTTARKASKSTAKSRTGSSGKRTKKSAAEIQYNKSVRFAKGVVLVGCSMLLTMLFFLQGQSLWKGMHEFYKGVFGFLGFLVPLIFLYCAVQMFREQSTYRFPLKVFFFSGTIVMFATTVYTFSSVNTQLGGFFQEIGNSYNEASLNSGAGVIGAFLGIPIVKLLGGVVGGLFSSIVLLFFLYMSFEALFINIIDKLKEPVSEKISDHKEIRTRVKAEEKKIKDENRKINRKQYVDRKVDQKVQAVRRRAEESEFRRINRTPFYEADSVEENTGKKGVKRQPRKSDDIQEPVMPDINQLQEQPFDEYSPVFDNIGQEDENAVDISSESTLDISELVRQDNEKRNLQNRRETQARQNAPASLSEMTKKSEDKTGEAARVKPSELGNVQKISTMSMQDMAYLKPPFTLLEPQPAEQEYNISRELQQSATKLVDTLKSFGVSTTITDICRGPSVTRYELQPAAGVKISKITNLADDIAMNLAAMGVRIEAPIPGKNAVGIEVPNKNVSVVKMRSLVESGEFQNAKSRLTVALGMDITGRITLADLARMPHLLIAGSTGSGKSVCINSMLVSLLYKAGPDEVKLILIDPKVVELGVYNGIPHLLVPVVTDPRKAAGALNWAVNEMLERYKTFAEFNVRDMHSYNRLVDKQNTEVEESYSDDADRTFEEDEMLAHAQAELNSSPFEPKEVKKLEKMCQIVIVIDELADLMMAAPNEVEESICRLAQMARAAGMHLVIATQRPSVDVITGLIKANVPSRIAFAVKSQIDSRTILDTGGAEKLVGRGDMLYSPIGTTKPIRVQGCFVDDDEIEHIVDFIKHNKTVEYDKDVIDEIERSAIGDNGGKQNDPDADGEMDPVMEQAIQCVVEAGQASTSLLQRRLRLGYARAGRLIDEMEMMGIVGPHEGSKPRQVLMTYQQWLERNMTRTDA